MNLHTISNFFKIEKNKISIIIWINYRNKVLNIIYHHYFKMFYFL